MVMDDARLTPMLRQYMDVKARYPDAILFFRIGDFYEMFFEDAETASRILEITLTSRDRNRDDVAPMCGVPVQAAESYLVRLVQAGKKVAVCEQVGDPVSAKGLVRREVVRVVSPGLITEEGGLGARNNNFLVCIVHVPKCGWGLSRLDISTGEFGVTEFAGEDDVFDELARLEPAEVLLPQGQGCGGLAGRVGKTLSGACLSFRPDEWFDVRRAGLALTGYFKVITLDGFGLSGYKAGIGAAGALLSYVLETQSGHVSHIRPVKPYHLREYLIIDETTKRNLELVANTLNGARKGALLEVLDQTMTPMGGRLMRQWILYPLMDISRINGRLSAIETLKSDRSARQSIRKGLGHILDLERLLSRLVVGTANARDLLGLKQSLARIPGLKEALAQVMGPESTMLHRLYDAMDPIKDLAELIDISIREDCPATVRDGRVIKEGFSQELDVLINIQTDARRYIAGLEAGERQRTGIQSLKVSYNRVFGYYIEVPRAQIAKVPEYYIRKQTLASAERYITDELKGLEAKIMGAEDRRLALEYELFEGVRAEVIRAGRRIQETASAIGRLDCLCALADVAQENDYVRPDICDDGCISICQGRHPVVERGLERGVFVPNDIEMDGGGRRLLLITGPNMAGKSTILRQTALIVIMAQMGGFVPAKSARIGLVDQIFSRVGATDYLSRGQSTFMVEMSETAHILHNATCRSLVILDEIGRGTSTYDGLSIAWAVAEYLLCKDEGRGVKTIFATHYHELTDMASRHDGVRNMQVEVREWGDEIVFIRRLVDGAANRSYGIQVAALAGVPEAVVQRAKEVLASIENRLDIRQGLADKNHGRRYICQKALPLQVEQPVAHGAEIKKRLLSVDLDNMTPINALNLLADIKKLISGD
jgi:DNA mismatch repair protein MutS